MSDLNRTPTSEHQTGSSRFRQLLPFLLMLLGAAFVFWKARYGALSNDEAYIITTSQRLYQGDALLVDDWFPAQLVGFNNYPFYALYRGMVHTTEGIVLYYRYVYSALWVLLIFAFRALLNGFVKDSRMLSFGCLYLMLFTALDQMTLSYNFWALGSLLLILGLQIRHSSQVMDYLTGFFIDLAALANPYLAVPFLLILLLGIIASVLHYSRDNLLGKLRSRWPAILLGTLPLFAVFLITVFSKSSLPQLLSSLPEILGRDHYTSQRSIAEQILQPLLRYCPLMLYAGLPLLAVSLADGKRAQHRVFYIYGQAVIFGAATAWFVYAKTFYGFNYIMLPISLFAVQLLVLSSQPRQPYLLIDITGLLYAVCLLYSSDLGLMSMCIGFSLIGFTAFPLMAELRPAAGANALMRICLSLVVLCQLGGEFVVRFRRTYYEKPKAVLNAAISSGAGKGILTSSSEAAEYEQQLQDAQDHLTAQADERILILPLSPQLYLDLDRRIGSYDTFTEESDERKLEILTRYYAAHPSSFPKSICILKDKDGLYNKAFLSLVSGREYAVAETETALYINME